jgi:integrase
MSKIAYHVFKKPKINRVGKPFSRWYYYFYDQNGKKIQKACPKCRNRSDAESYIRTLPPLNPLGADNPETPVRIIAETMYIPGSAHVDRRRQLGKSINRDTILECRNYISLIIEKWGNRALKSIETDEILNYLFTVKRSGSWKNRYLSVFKELYAEAPRYGCKAPSPDFPRFALHKKKADIFTTSELKAFLNPENFPNDMFFLFFLLSLSGGLRLGEARGVRLKQFIFTHKALIIDGFCKENGERTNYNKKGSEENPKFRIVLLPDYTLLKVLEYIQKNPIEPDDFLFTYHGKPVKQNTAELVFIRALVKAGLTLPPAVLTENGTLKKGVIVKRKNITPDGRRLVPHSLRYTYVTRMRRELSAKELQPMTGHLTEEMVDYYNRIDFEEAMSSLPKAETALQNLLNFTAL